jgi:hypothetical protein
VSKFYAEGMVSAAVNKRFGREPAVQIEYAPYSKPTAYARRWPGPPTRTNPWACSRAAPLGITVWIIDVGDSPATYPPYFPIVNGSDIDFVHPFAMTILGNPARQLLTPNIMQHLIGNPCHVPADQLWGSQFGPVS